MTSSSNRSLSPLARLPWLGRLLGAGPLAVPPHAFSLSAGDLGYAGFARDDSGFQLREQHREELPEDAFQPGLLGGPLREPASFALSVKRLIERVSVPVKEASLVLPDAWMRVAFAEIADLPRRSAEREEVLRWKLKRLVPFPVEEVRLDATRVPPLPGQPSGGRVLLGFAIEQLLGQVESAFAASGVRLGRITNSSLALLSALASNGSSGRTAERGELTALVLAEDTGYALLAVHGDAPLLHRFKSLSAQGGSEGGLDAGSLDRLVNRDLVLTRNFLSEQAPGSELQRAIVVAPPASEDRWIDWLGNGLGVPVERLGGEHLVPMSVAGPAPSWREVAPLLGAVREEVVH